MVSNGASRTYIDEVKAFLQDRGNVTAEGLSARFVHILHKRLVEAVLVLRDHLVETLELQLTESKAAGLACLWGRSGEVLQS